MPTTDYLLSGQDSVDDELMFVRILITRRDELEVIGQSLIGRKILPAALTKVTDAPAATRDDVVGKELQLAMLGRTSPPLVFGGMECCQAIRNFAALTAWPRFTELTSESKEPRKFVGQWLLKNIHILEEQELSNYVQTSYRQCVNDPIHGSTFYRRALGLSMGLFYTNSGGVD